MESTVKDMTKSYYMGALIITISLIIMSLSLSYAFFENSVKTTGNTEVSISSGDLTMNFTDNKQVIDVNGVSLIDASQKDTLAKTAKFSVTLPTGSVSRAKYDLYLTNISFDTDNKLKNAALKWELVRDDGTVSTISGDFSSYTSGDLPFLTDVEITSGQTQSYTLKVWLQNEQNVNQNNLLGGQFSAKIGFTGKSIANS